jgi:enamine deaminase RidA (YjgF/YER057c/UK114 family)
VNERTYPGARVRFETDAAPPSTGFRSQALAAGGVLFTGGQIGAPYRRGTELRALAPTFEGQVDAALEHLAAVTWAAGAPLERVVELSAFTTVPDGERVVRERSRAFLGFDPPLLNHVAVDDCAMHGDVELDWAVALPGTDPVAATDALRQFMHAPAGEVIASGPFLVLNGARATGADMAEQSAALIDRVLARLEPPGATLQDVTKLTVYIQAFDIYPAFNAVTLRRFAAIIPPTRSVVVAPHLTGDALVSVDVLATAPIAT